MLFLLDMGVSISVVRWLRAMGHDAIHLREEGLEKTPDLVVLAKALNEERVLLTFDLDFGDLLAFGRAHFPSVVIFRLTDATPKTVIARLTETLSTHEQSPRSGALIVVRDRQLRVRHLPIIPVD